MAESFEFQFSSATSEPPTGSQIRLDNADASLASKLWVRNLTTPGEDVWRMLMLSPVGSSVYVQDYDDHSRALVYKTTGAPADKVDYVELPVAWQVSAALPLLTQKVVLVLVGPGEEPPTPTPPGVPYATVEQLARALRVTLTPVNQPDLQACLDAAAQEIDHFVDRTEPIPLGDALAERVNILRGVEWFKSNDAAFGVIGFAETGALQAPRDSFARHGRELIPLKEQFGLA